MAEVIDVAGTVPAGIRTTPRRRSGGAGPGGRAGIIGLTILALFVLLTVLAPWISPYGPSEIDGDQVLGGPSAEHLLGNDELGRDVLTRLLYSYRVSFVIAVASVAFSLPLGVLLGTLAGYFGRVVDNVIMRPIEMLMAFPALLLSLAMISILGSGVAVTVAAITVIYLPVFARIARASTQVVANELYIQAARTRGTSTAAILTRHVIPNALAPCIVQAAIAAAWAIQIEAALSFLGLGVQPPTPSLGTMLAQGQGFLTQAPWIGIFPGLSLALTVLAFNLIGDWLRARLENGTA
ncbi:ABC transporter permease [Jiangella muralis]|uniref:ABC transporter permease n=1 Tax=Jiangella muralis TaxID=702383 RepID=UPI00069E749D|nr:ABC transporter permease [Jiangella muralis]